MIKGTILVVEDEKDLRLVLSDIFTNDFERVLSASDGFEAMRLIEKNPNIICIITDIKMPEVSGFELFKYTRQRKFNIPFIFLTGENTEEYIMEVLKHDSIQLLRKPFRIERLIEAVRMAIGHGYL